jgi:cytochrome o ubiquinol oxidase operon protein cyoD
MMNAKEFQRSLNTYVFGFGASLMLSILSYLTVSLHWFGTKTMTAATILLCLAVLQLIVQLICFLHLGLGPKAVVKTHIFLFTFSTLLIIVIGSLWIMQNLNYRMGMSPDQMNRYMLHQNKIGF